MRETKLNLKNPRNKNAPSTEVAVFGEVLYDCFPDDRRVLGGAPFNVAWGLQGFGHQPLFISAVGNDTGGREIQVKMNAWGMSTAGLQINSKYATGEVFVSIKDDEPSYEICEPRAWDYIEACNYSPEKFIYHGSLALRNKDSLNAFKSLAYNSAAKRFFDVNLRPPYYSIKTLKEWIHRADWLKLNIDELGMILDSKPIRFDESQPYIRQVIDEYEVENVLLTGGSQGAMIIGAYGEAICTPAPKPEYLVDTVGAGDAFSAFTIHGILSGLPVDEIVRQAGRFAAKVCAIQGATSLSKDFYKYSL